MATASDASIVLQTTPGKRNFQRLSRLLIAGGTSVLREVLDSILSPSTLPTVLRVPGVQAQLKGARLTRPQWDCLYPAPGRYGKSSDFDITLLFRLLRQICGLPSPSLGWNELPAAADQTMSDDLARVKFYRNTVYGHVSEAMEISGDEFNDLWAKISGALIRLANHISEVKGLEWQQAIAKLETAPLTPEDEQNLEELKEWYKRDSETKEIVEREHQLTRQTITSESEQTREEMRQIKGVLTCNDTAISSIVLHHTIGSIV